MAHNFGSLVFTPVVKALQEKYGSRRQYARMETGGAKPDRLGPEEIAFIAERDTFIWRQWGLPDGRIFNIEVALRVF